MSIEHSGGGMGGVLARERACPHHREAKSQSPHIIMGITAPPLRLFICFQCLFDDAYHLFGFFKAGVERVK